MFFPRRLRFTSAGCGAGVRHVEEARAGPGEWEEARKTQRGGPGTGAPCWNSGRGGSGGRGEGAHGEPWGRGRSTLHTRRPRRPALLVTAEIHGRFTASSLSPVPPDRVVAEIETKVCLLLAGWSHRLHHTFQIQRRPRDPGRLREFPRRTVEGGKKTKCV